MECLRIVKNKRRTIDYCLNSANQQCPLIVLNLAIARARKAARHSGEDE
jgi:hypothetical protein